MNKYFISHDGTKVAMLSPEFELSTFNLKTKEALEYSFATKSRITQIGLMWIHLTMKDITPYQFQTWMDNYWSFHESLLKLRFQL